MGGSVRYPVGEAIEYARISELENRAALTEFLQDAVFKLAAGDQAGASARDVKL